MNVLQRIVLKVAYGPCCTHRTKCKYHADLSSALAYCRRVRVFRFQTGKLRRTYDESVAAANELQRGESELYNLEPIDFGRRMAGEKDLMADPEAPQPNAIFDESGNFIIYATLLGIKVFG